MKIEKEPLVRNRLRRPPESGWSWIDRRFLKTYASRLHRNAILLYYFLMTVGDKNGLSYYGEATIARLLRMEVADVVRARGELEYHDLIAYQEPLYQVLSLLEKSFRKIRPPETDSGPKSFAEILRRLKPTSIEIDNADLHQKGYRE